MSRVSVDSGYFEVAFWGLVIFGAGLGTGSVAGSIASLGGVAEQDSGVASGVQNASFQIGGALGIAVVAAVSSAGASTAGYRITFLSCWAFVAIGLTGTALVADRKRSPEGLPADLADSSTSNR